MEVAAAREKEMKAKVLPPLPGQIPLEAPRAVVAPRAAAAGANEPAPPGEWSGGRRSSGSNFWHAHLPDRASALATCTEFNDPLESPGLGGGHQSCALDQ